MQKLLIFQSLWAMERRHTDGFERSLEDNLHMIAGAGFDGINADWQDRAQTLRLAGLLKSHGLRAEAVCFPKTVDDLEPALELAVETGVHHLNIHAMARLRRLEDCVAILEGWQRLAEQVDFPVYVETHRDRMTTDLFFVLDILDELPDLKLVGDLSHFLVGREFAWPVSEENHGYIHRVLENCWAMHGRVASREQVQIEIAFPHHRQWLDLFLGWWEHGFRSWQRRADADATLAFVCELGPRPYAITGPDGNEMSDRWSEALMLRDLVRETWDRTQSRRHAASNLTDVDA